MKVDIGQNIRLLRTKAGLTQQQLADRIGMSQSIVGKLEMETRSMKIETLEKIATALDVDISELIFKAHPFPYRHIPIKGTVNAGKPMDAIEDTDCETIPFDTNRSDLIAFNVRGDSMNYVAPHGAVIIVDPREKDLKSLHKQPVVAIQEGEGVFKIWDQELKLFKPKSTNPEHDDIKPQYEMQVVGKVIAYLMRF